MDFMDQFNITAILLAFIASSGFWAFLQYILSKKDIRTSMLVGLGHDRIVYLGMKYIERGYITRDEYENLHDYLYVPYNKMGGNGSAERIMDEVKRLPIREHPDHLGKSGSAV